MTNLYVFTVVDCRGEFVEIENSVFYDRVSAAIAMQDYYKYCKSLLGINLGESWCENYGDYNNLYAEFSTDGDKKYITGTINKVAAC